ncbi:signal peptidase I [Enterococcus ureasiticus]|uniref:Signal peptidase I n=1 Tax=Enterococcus ureasiticus TaxID=903984 RepID=A0A1E5GN66_9ENTE|nr:signal peptidase I [Enterococcus ureasiticus]OEG14144.1 signal peptidase I [Enterococcus ureasiticus]
MKQANKTSKKVASIKKQRKKSNQNATTNTAIKNRNVQSKKDKRTDAKIARYKKNTIKRTLKKRKKQRHQFYKEIGVSFFLLLTLFFVFQWLFFSLPKVNGYGMTTTLNDGDRLFVSKYSKIKRFDMVYLKQPDKKQPMVRRVIALPGEEIAYEKDQLLINKRPVVERFLKNELNEAEKEQRLLTEDFTLAELTGSITLPKESYFVLGDNRHYAADSRDFGWIEQKDILGIVKARIIPFHHMSQF